MFSLAKIPFFAVRSEQKSIRIHTISNHIMGHFSTQKCYQLWFTIQRLHAALLLVMGCVLGKKMKGSRYSKSTDFLSKMTCLKWKLKCVRVSCTIVTNICIFGKQTPHSNNLIFRPFSVFYTPYKLNHILQEIKKRMGGERVSQCRLD